MHQKFYRYYISLLWCTIFWSIHPLPPFFSQYTIQSFSRSLSGFLQRIWITIIVYILSNRARIPAFDNTRAHARAHARTPDYSSRSRIVHLHLTAIKKPSRNTRQGNGETRSRPEKWGAEKERRSGRRVSAYSVYSARWKQFLFLALRLYTSALYIYAIETHVEHPVDGESVWSLVAQYTYEFSADKFMLEIKESRRTR